MKKFKLLATTAIAAVLMAGCGGGGETITAPPVNPNPLGLTTIVSFGDSLSDPGAYAVGTVAAPANLGGGAGGRYTVNSGTATPTKIWLDYVSTQLGLPAPCAAVTGLDGSTTLGLSVPVSQKPSCTNYAQGGSRVTNSIGPGNKNIPGNEALGQLTYPLTAQVANHLGRNGGAFNAKSLVTVLAGGNDVFIQGAVAQAAAAINPTTPSTVDAFTATATNLGGWTTAQQTAVWQATSTAAAQTALQNGLLANMGKAGTELATLIKTEMVAKGAKTILVVNLPNVGASPNGIENGTQTAALSTGMAQAFNQALSNGLTGVTGVVIADAFATSTDQFNNPSKYGLSNVTDRSCKRGAPATSGNILGGTSLVCNPTNVIAGDISRYGFADDVHPSPYGHQLIAQFATKVLAAAGWIGQ